MSPDQSEWWERFDADPARAVNAILWGFVTVPPWTRYDPSSVLTFLFAERPEAMGVLDRVLADWLETRVREQGEDWIQDLEDGLDSALYQAFSLIPRLELPLSAALLRRCYGEFETVAHEISGENFDALLVLRIALARTQTDRSLLGWWYRQSEVAADRRDDAQMEFALAGVCGMPRLQGGTEYDLPDEALAAMMRWGRRLGPQEEERFLAVWARLSGRYPTSPDTWAERLSPLLRANADRPFVRWWAAAAGMAAPPPHRTGEQRKSYWRGEVPNAGVTNELLGRLKTLRGGQTDRAVDNYARRYQAYADATGDLSNIAPAFDRLGRSLLRSRPDLSLRLAESAIAYDRGHVQSWDLAAQALLVQERTDLAEARYWRAMEMFDKDSAFPLRLAQLLERQGRDLEAEALYRRAMAIDARHVPSRHDLAMLLFRHGRLAEAEALHREVLAMAPENDPSITELALVLNAQGRGPEAEAELRRAMARSGDDPFFPNALGKLLMEWGRWDEAIALYREAAELHSNDAVCRSALGAALVRCDEWRQYEGEMQGLIGDLERLDRDAARALAGHLAARRQGKALREGAVDHDALAPTPWSILSPEAIMLRAEFITRRVTGDLLLAKDEEGRAWLSRLRREADEALDDMLARHPRHPVVQLVALRRGKIAAAALPKAGTGSYAVDLALADHADDMDVLRDLADRLKYMEAPLAWLALARRKDADAVGSLLTWSADRPSEAEGTAFAHLRQRLSERFDLSKLARLPAPQRALVLGNAMAEIADDLLVKALMLYVAEELAPPAFAQAAPAFAQAA